MQSEDNSHTSGKNSPPNSSNTGNPPIIGPFILGVIFTGIWLIAAPWQEALQGSGFSYLEALVMTTILFPLLVMGIFCLGLGVKRLIDRKHSSRKQ